MEIDPIIKQAIEIGIKLGIEAYKNERNANLRNKKILLPLHSLNPIRTW